MTEHKKYTGMSSFIPKGRTKRRYKFMYKRRLYQKSFEGTKKQCDEQFKLWKENKLKTLKDRPFDGSKTWSFFREAYLSYITNKTDKKTGRKYYKPRTIEEYGYAFNKFETLAKITYVNDLTLDIIRKVRAQLEEEASQKGCDNYGANKTLRCIYTALKWGIDRGIVPDISISEGKFLGAHLMYNPLTKAPTLYMDFRPNGKTSEIRAVLKKDGKAVSEVWSYQWLP